jgi:Ca-activated chloride channel family protein
MPEWLRPSRKDMYLNRGISQPRKHSKPPSIVRLLVIGTVLMWAVAVASWTQVVWGRSAFSGPSRAESSADGGAARRSSHLSSANNQNGDTVIRKRVMVVNVPVTVLDKRGAPVIDLSQDDFKIFEDGKRQPITYFRQEPLPPLRIGLVLDTSNSMRPQMKFEKDAATQFVDNMLEAQNTRNQIFLETFDESSDVIQGFTADPDVLEAKIRELKAGGGKAMYDAIYNACEKQMLKSGDPENTRRLLVLISDGIDVSSTHTLDEAVSMAHRAQTLIYVVGNSPYGYSNPGDKYLNELADETGGWAFFPLEQEVGADLETGYLAHSQINDDGSQNAGLGARSGIYTAEQLEHLADALDNLGRQLNSQYSIGYTPIDQSLDGTYRRIKVVVHRRGVRVRYKTGWFALAQP